MKKMVFKLNKSIGPVFIQCQNYLNNYDLLSVLEICLDVITRMRCSFKDAQFLDDLRYPGIEMYYDKQRNQVNICNVGLIKAQVDTTEMSDEEFTDYSDRYEAYYNKRYAEIDKLEIMTWHWQDLEKQWKEFLLQKPQYLIIEMTDEIPPQKIKMIGKDELSAEEIEYFTKEHEKYIKYNKARSLYRRAHPDYSYEEWRGSQDDEFEADIMKYYED